MANQLKPVKGSRDPKNEGVRKVNAGLIQGFIGGCQAIVQRYPGTAAAQKAEELMAQYR